MSRPTLDELARRAEDLGIFIVPQDNGRFDLVDKAGWTDHYDEVDPTIENDLALADIDERLWDLAMGRLEPEPPASRRDRISLSMLAEALGTLTHDAGFVIKLPGGAEFKVTIVQLVYPPPR